MIKVFETNYDYNLYTLNNTSLLSDILYYVKVDNSGHFYTNNVDGESKIYDLGGGGDTKKIITAKFNVPATTYDIYLINQNYLSEVTEMYIDDVKLDEPIFKYRFETTGEHIVTFVFNSLNKIYDNMFDNKYQLTEIEIPEGIIDIGFEAFAWNNTNVILPSTIRTIGKGAFRGSNIAISYNIPTGVTVIDEDTFNFAQKITSVTLPNTLIKIGKNSFSQCKGITSINIPDNINYIGVNAFGQCTNLTTVTIGSGIKYIDDQAFQNCSKLASVTINATTPPILGTYYAFGGNATGRKIYVPSSSVSSYKSATGWSAYADDIVAIP